MYPTSTCPPNQSLYFIKTLPEALMKCAPVSCHKSTLHAGLPDSKFVTAQCPVTFHRYNSNYETHDHICCPQDCTLSPIAQSLHPSYHCPASMSPKYEVSEEYKHDPLFLLVCRRYEKSRKFSSQNGCSLRSKTLCSRSIAATLPKTLIFSESCSSCHNAETRLSKVPTSTILYW